MTCKVVLSEAKLTFFLPRCSGLDDTESGDDDRHIKAQDDINDNLNKGKDGNIKAGKETTDDGQNSADKSAEHLTMK